MNKKKSPQSKVFKCQHCDYTCKAKGALTRHINAKHDGVTSKIGSSDEHGENGLTPQEEQFCQLYASDREFFGNGVQSYIEAYDVQLGKGEGMHSYEYCKYRASVLLKRNRVLKRINEIFEGRGLNNAFVDKNLEMIITQKAELRTSLEGIKEYNKLKKRTSERHDHVHTFADIKGMSDKELEQEKEKLEKFFTKQ